MTPVDAIRFRQLLGTFATGVAVITARDGAGGPAGMTASAIASVSLEPPLLLVCVWQAADFHPVIAAAHHFGLTVLAESQEDISRRFAGKGPDRFAATPWHSHVTGVPLIEGAAAHIVCARREAVAAGDHTVFLGEVLDGTTFSRAPLLHVHGAYRHLR